ncbi:DUF6671 family protein [Curvibacter sp. AEP1-3]|uniref:DUF6671 family protein n=1 Tax=Curvibacter sp. AEP1-3 TaxID=1844971 RepID=UPI000B3C371A|nr:DUF6671 family protein [Curvibacter sp. AEP1-3]
MADNRASMHAIALLTQHGKQSAVEGPLQEAGFSVSTISGFDTDRLGTFTGTVARKGTQVDAAASKAKLATELSGWRFGLGSEGSFGPDPYTGMIPWGREVLAFWDAPAQRLICAAVQGHETNYRQITVQDWNDAADFASAIGFPAHGLIIGKPGQTGFDKDCKDLAALEDQVQLALQGGPVELETDMRAHRNPTRMRMIRRCAERLSHRLRSNCPDCASYGFGEESPIAGAPCESCGLPTHAIMAKNIRCDVCGHSQRVDLVQSVPASRCNYCNP